MEGIYTCKCLPVVDTKKNLRLMIQDLRKKLYLLQTNNSSDFRSIQIKNKKIICGLSQKLGDQVDIRSGPSYNKYLKLKNFIITCTFVMKVILTYPHHAQGKKAKPAIEDIKISKPDPTSCLTQVINA